MSENPFAALSKPVNKPDDSVELTNETVTEETENHSSDLICKWQVIDALISVFRVSLNKNIMIGHQEYIKETDPDNLVSINCVDLSDLDESISTTETVDQLLYERLMIEESNNIRIKVLSKHFNKENEENVVNYLFLCYRRLEKIENTLTSEQKSRIRNVIISQTSLLICHPELFPHYEGKLKASFVKLLDIYLEDSVHSYSVSEFIRLIFKEITRKRQIDPEEVPLSNAINSDFLSICDRLKKISIIDPKIFSCLKTIQFFTDPIVSKCFLELNFPKNTTDNALLALDFQKSLLGLLLSVTCLPNLYKKEYEFFQSPSKSPQQEHIITEQNLGMHLNSLTSEIHEIFVTLLKQSECRVLTLEWISSCLHAFRDRAKMWTNEVLMMTGSQPVQSDGFMLNLSSVLLKLCKPFCKPYSPKLLKVDPRFCVNIPEKSSGIFHQEYLKNLKSETTLVSRSLDLESVQIEFNFMTECFYATHKALQLGFRAVHERFVKLAQDLQQIQRVYQDATTQTTGMSDTVEMLTEKLDRGMTQFFSLKAVLCESNYLESMLMFHLSTATWLINLAVSEDCIQATKNFKEVSLPLPSEWCSENLQYVPEFIVENLADFVVFLRRFSEKTFRNVGYSLEPIMTFILVFMGSAKLMKNPHLRAKLAETLESLMPSHSETGILSYGSGTDKLFTDHHLISELVPTLMHVFVSIEINETSGESVAFEQKFYYRRPMYIVLKHIWNIELHRNRMKELADIAEANIEAATPPIFLRFINLLINDAIFLLDEALEYMSKLRKLQMEKENGSWNNLNPLQRREQEANLHHVGRLARFHNVIARNTIETLSWLTKEIKTIFCHRTIVTRVSSMLNYFLYHLVGPQKRNFKVKDKNEYEFKPAEIVHDICLIYFNLADSSSKKYKQFCLAIARDDRSYSPDLLPQASDVLTKIGYGIIANDILNLGKLIEEVSQNHSKREIPLDEVPEEFLDPIMSNLMRDPVILPKSGVCVDRSTIARHLLSDPTDPFSRSHLTMEQVIPNTDLKEKIRHFIQDKQKQLQSESTIDNQKIENKDL